MRVKLDSRRQAIIDHAGAVFREYGYERASMSQIAARVGGSKATLYGYFKSKQEIFSAVMFGAMESQAEAMFALMDLQADDPSQSLRTFGCAYLDLLLSPEINAVMRIGIAEGHNASVGSVMYEQGPQRGLLMVAEHLQSWIDRGVLRQVDSQIAAQHLLALLKAGVFEPMLFGAKLTSNRAGAVADAVDVFLRAYGTNVKAPSQGDVC